MQAHVPLSHAVPPAHTTLQPPQCSASTLVSTQAPAHDERPPVQADRHSPRSQVAVFPEQETSQPPQCRGSRSTRTHPTAQVVPPLAHVVEVSGPASSVAGVVPASTGGPGNSKTSRPHATRPSKTRMQPGRAHRLTTFLDSMADPLVLVVLLGTTPAPPGDAVLASTRRALGPDAIVLAETAEVRSDVDALVIARRLRASAIAQVTWSADATVARLHVHAAPELGWADDELRFGEEDAAAERARTVGYTIATMVQRLDEPRPRPGGRAPSAPSHVELRLGGTGTIGDVASAGGVLVGARLWPMGFIGIEAFAFARLGPVAGTSTAVGVGAGPVARHPIGTWLELAIATDLVVMHQALRRDGPARERWLGAIDVMGELAASFGAHLGAYATGGAEVAFGPTPVRVGPIEVGSFPVMRALVGVGGRYRF